VQEWLKAKQETFYSDGNKELKRIGKRDNYVRYCDMSNYLVIIL